MSYVIKCNHYGRSPSDYISRKPKGKGCVVIEFKDKDRWWVEAGSCVMQNGKPNILARSPKWDSAHALIKHQAELAKLFYKEPYSAIYCKYDHQPFDSKISRLASKGVKPTLVTIDGVVMEERLVAVGRTFCTVRNDGRFQKTSDIEDFERGRREGFGTPYDMQYNAVSV
jgi:hypothetical protein